MNKLEHWEKIKKQYEDIEMFVNIDVEGIENDSKYFHPIFTLKDGSKITAQGDLDNSHIYAFVFYNEIFRTEIDNSFFRNFVMAYSSQSKELLLKLCEKLSQIKKFTGSIEQLAYDYFIEFINNNAIEEIKNNLINKINVATEFLTEMRDIKNGKNNN